MLGCSSELGQLSDDSWRHVVLFIGGPTAAKLALLGAVARAWVAKAEDVWKEFLRRDFCSTECRGASQALRYYSQLATSRVLSFGVRQ